MNSKLTCGLSIVLTLCCCQCFLCGDEVDEGDSADEEFVLVITLDNDGLNSLMKNGFLKTAVPKKLWNRVSAIRFRRPTSFLSKPFAVEDRTDKQGRSLGVFVDQSMLSRLDYQPVEMRVFDANYSSVVVVLDRQIKNDVDPNLNQSGVALRGPNDSPEFFIRINANRSIAGSLKNEQDLEVKTQFGKLQIGFNHISGIRFVKTPANAPGNLSVVSVFVVLTDGNRFSGTIENRTIVVISRWGEKELQLSELESITSDPNAAFMSDPANPNRWNLVTEVPAKPQKINTSNN